MSADARCMNLLRTCSGCAEVSDLVLQLCAGHIGASGFQGEHRGSGCAALLQIHPAHVCVACSGDVCGTVRLWRPAGCGVGRRPARCLGVPHHLVCQLCQPLLGLSGRLQHFPSSENYMLAASLSRIANMLRLLLCCGLLFM